MRKAFLPAIVVIGLLACVSTRQAPGQAPAPSVRIDAPVWHVGEWWRVQVPDVVLDLRGDALPHRPPHDSRTQFIIYRYAVVGQDTLTYERQVGRRHIGQAVPPEACWVVTVTPEQPRRRKPWGVFRMYFRTEDLSLRQVVQEHGAAGHPTLEYLYSSTAVNDDDETKPVVVRDRGPAWSGLDLVTAWPQFPLSAKEDTGAEQTATAATIAMGHQQAPGLRVTLGHADPTGTTLQDWVAGYPWWVFAMRGGLQQSRLIQTSGGFSHNH